MERFMSEGRREAPWYPQPHESSADDGQQDTPGGSEGGELAEQLVKLALEGNSSGGSGGQAPQQGINSAG
jgi:hypothetical protein